MTCVGRQYFLKTLALCKSKGMLIGKRAPATVSVIKSRNYSSQQESTEENNSEDQEYDTKMKVLKASLPFVHQHGWTSTALAKGADQEGLPGVAHGMFPRGGAELVFFFYRDCNKQLVDLMKSRTENIEEKPKTGEFIQNSVEERLRMIIPYKNKWPQAMAIQAMPQNAFDSWLNLAALMDDIWFYAGDRSTDFNWYTKRGSLAGVYKSTEIFMLQDNSEDYQDTWEFLSRRLEDLTSFGKFARNVQQSGTVLSDGLYGFSIMAKNLCRMNSQ